MRKNIFIDGESGTTGLQVYERLNKHPYVNVLPVDKDRRKSPSYKKEMLASCDVVFLCLPDKSAIETVEIADQLDNESPIIIDASTAHRTHQDWAYGLPELGQNYRNKIIGSKRIAVPGCYPTGANIIIKPLIDKKYISTNNPIIISAVSGYSGGGKDLINYFNKEDHEPFFTYGLNLDHKHLPEIKFHNNLVLNPIFYAISRRFYSRYDCINSNSFFFFLKKSRYKNNTNFNGRILFRFKVCISIEKRRRFKL
jgi:N-acetyl-gamma-glutamyl-phosphate reductase